tara:strand:+ start:2339 stop:2566 length:228 start_codon:yes stop_codon:yes gene_type:complete
MNEEDIEEILSYNYWPCVLIDTSPESSSNIFIARLYKLGPRTKTWRIVKTRRFNTPLEAWEYLRETLMDTLKFVL